MYNVYKIQSVSDGRDLVENAIGRWSKIGLNLLKRDFAVRFLSSFGCRFLLTLRACLKSVRTHPACIFFPRLPAFLHSLRKSLTAQSAHVQNLNRLLSPEKSGGRDFKDEQFESREKISGCFWRHHSMYYDCIDCFNFRHE